MENDQHNFELEYKSGKIKVRRHALSGQVIYQVQFSDNRLPLVITRAINANAARFWTSIPQGRQREAEEIGPLIAKYIKSHQ